MQKVTHNFYVFFLMGVSFFAMLFIGMFTFYSTTNQMDSPWRRPMIGSIYALICVSGISAAFFPRRCSRLFHYGKEIDTRKTRNSGHNDRVPQNSSQIFGWKIVYGHHPHCKDFLDHEFKIGNKTLCIGCLGLSLGALVSLLGTVLYFFSGWQIEKESVLAVAMGISGVALGLLQLPVIKVRGLLRLFPNTSLAVGTFLVIIGVDTLVHSVVVDLFLLIVSVFWLWTRISLSRWDHERVCKACGFKCFRQRLGLHNPAA